MRASLWLKVLSLASFGLAVSGFVGTKHQHPCSRASQFCDLRLASSGAEVGDTKVFEDAFPQNNDDERHVPKNSEIMATSAISVLTTTLVPFPAIAAEVVERKTDLSPIIEDAGKWFFVAYVVFSLLAGAKEMVVRFQNWKSDSGD